MNIEIVTNNRPNIDDAAKLYASVGWGTLDNYDEKSKNKYRKAFDNSYVFSAYCGNNLVGLLRFFTDKHDTTYIIELVVSPEFQRQGIGDMLLTKLNSKYNNTTIYTDSIEAYSYFYLNRGFKQHKLIRLFSKKRRA